MAFFKVTDARGQKCGSLQQTSCYYSPLVNLQLTDQLVTACHENQLVAQQTKL